jgi:hypothetical protein
MKFALLIFHQKEQRSLNRIARLDLTIGQFPVSLLFRCAVLADPGLN